MVGFSLCVAVIDRPESYHTPCIALAVGTAIGIVTGRPQRVDMTLDGVREGERH